MRDGDIGYVRPRRQQRLVRIGQGGRGLAEGRRGNPHHLVGDPGRLRGGDGEPHRGEDIDVVALRDRPFHAVALQRCERRTGGDQRTPVGPIVQFGRVRLGAARRVGQREDDRPLGLSRELAHDVFSESARRSGQPQQDADVDVVYDVGELGGPDRPQSATRLAGWANSRCAVGQVGAVVGEQTHDVDDPDPRRARPARTVPPPPSRAGSCRGRRCRPNPRPSMTTCCCDSGRAGDLRRAVQRAEGDGGGALDVVVEGEQLVAVAVEDRQRVRGGEVFPLQQHVGEFFCTAATKWSMNA